MTVLSQKRNTKLGFSLLELLVVLAIMGVMMGLLGFSFLSTTSSDLGDAQRKILSLVYKAKFVALSSGSDSRIIVHAEPSDSEKYLRFAEVISLDKNASYGSGGGTWRVDQTSRVLLPENIWFVADGLESDNAEWPQNGVCIWSATSDDDLLLTDPANGFRSEDVAAGSKRYLYVNCNAQGVFTSPTYPSMPRLVLARGSLTPAVGGVLKPKFTNQRDLSGIQIQPFGGIIMMDSQDFNYE